MLSCQGYRGNGLTIIEAAELVRRTGQVAVPVELRADISAYGFLKRETTEMFEIIIVNLDAGSYLRRIPQKALAKV